MLDPIGSDNNPHYIISEIRPGQWGILSLLSIFWGGLAWIALWRSCWSIWIGLKVLCYWISSVFCSLSCCISQLQLSFTWHSLSILCCALAVMFAAIPLLGTATVLNFIYRQFVLQWTKEHQDLQRYFHYPVPFLWSMVHIR